MALSHHRVLTQQFNGPKGLLPLEALQYVQTILSSDPHAFDDPGTPWFNLDSPSGSVNPPRGSSRDAANKNRAPAQDASAQETQSTPLPDTTPSPQPSAPRHQSRRSPRPATPPPFEQAFAAAAGPADALNTALLQLLADLPPNCPDVNWGIRRQLQTALLSIPDQAGATNRPVAPNNLPVVTSLTALIATAARHGSGQARNLATYLASFLDTAATGQGGMHPPPHPPPHSPAPSGGPGRGHSSRPPSPRNGSGDPGGSGPQSPEGSLKRRRSDNEPNDEDQPRDVLNGPPALGTGTALLLLPAPGVAALITATSRRCLSAAAPLSGPSARPPTTPVGMSPPPSVLKGAPPRAQTDMRPHHPGSARPFPQRTISSPQSDAWSPSATQPLGNPCPRLQSATATARPRRATKSARASCGSTRAGRPPSGAALARTRPSSPMHTATQPRGLTPRSIKRTVQTSHRPQPQTGRLRPPRSQSQRAAAPPTSLQVPPT